MISSHSFVKKDFKRQWYKRWSKELRQYRPFLENHDLYANKFWQNAIMAQALFEHGQLMAGKSAIGFGVGQERLPALFAKYKVAVTATDQDFTTKKAGHWAEHELAIGMRSLNKLTICEPETFAENVSYMPVDMTSIPKSLHSKYDFLWSNCALGHLGTLQDGLAFIEKSLHCLKPGGWAVHTTEINILSNEETVMSGSTVIFRIADLHTLQKKLLTKGYVMKPFSLELPRRKADQRISILPQFGNGYSRIQVAGHMATQGVLIIHKPSQPLTDGQKADLQKKSDKVYARNQATIKQYRDNDVHIKQIFTSQSAPIEAVKVGPELDKISLKIPHGQAREVYITYRNMSDIPLFSSNGRLAGSKPIVLATTNPQDRESIFRDKSWPSANRLAYDIYQPDSLHEPVLADYILPHITFGFRVLLNTKKVAPGEYDESVCLVQEGLGWVGNSTLKLHITVT